MTDTTHTQGTVPLPGQNSRWVTRLRLFILCFFAALTLYGAYFLVISDWQDITGYWLTRRNLLLACFLLSACDVCTDGLIWIGLLRQHGIRLGIRRGLLLFLSGYAGYLMPVQLGRLFRATELTRLYGVPLRTSTTAELTLLAFVVVSCVSIFAGAFLYSWSRLLALAAPLALIPIALFCAEFISRRIPKLPVQTPRGYWLRPTTLLLCLLSSTGWLINGLILYLIFRGVAEGLMLHQTIMIVASNLFVGISSGLPGGIGITETYIGGMMYWLSTPPEHLVLAVAAFRITTFWLWIPMGWLALVLNGILYSNSRPEDRQE